MSEKILACPFPACGSERCMIDELQEVYYVECPDCRAVGPDADTEAKAIRLWNAAANALAAKDAEIEKLNNELDIERKQNCYLEKSILKWNERVVELEFDRDKMAAAYADTEERRYKAVIARLEEQYEKEYTKLFAAMRKIDVLERHLIETTDRAMIAELQRDEARRVARHWYQKAQEFRKELDDDWDAFTRYEPPTSVDKESE